MMDWPLWTAAAAGGALGALTRAGVHRVLVGLASHVSRNAWAQLDGALAATLVANLLGSFLLGLVLTGFARFETVSAWLQVLLMTGFCGALTTFSTFCADVHRLYTKTRLAPVLLLIAAHLLFSLAAVALGIATGRLGSPEDQAKVATTLDPDGRSLYIPTSRWAGRTVHRSPHRDRADESFHCNESIRPIARARLDTIGGHPTRRSLRSPERRETCLKPTTH